MKSIISLLAMGAIGLAGSASAAQSPSWLGVECARVDGIHRQLKAIVEAEEAKCGGAAAGCDAGETPEGKAARAQRRELRQEWLKAYRKASDACAASRADQTSQVLRAAASDAVAYALRTRALAGEWLIGTVIWFDAARGFGFIARDDGGRDVFVHISTVESSGLADLDKGDRVEFELEVDRRGKTSAAELRPIR